MIEYLAAVGGGLIGFGIGYWASGQNIEATVLEAVQSERARLNAQHQASEKALEERLNEAHAADIKKLNEAHAADVLAAFQRGKESDGVVRNAKGQMQSVKKASTPATPKAPAKAKRARFDQKLTALEIMAEKKAAKKPCARKVTK